MDEGKVKSMAIIWWDLFFPFPLLCSQSNSQSNNNNWLTFTNNVDMANLFDFKGLKNQVLVSELSPSYHGSTEIGVLQLLQLFIIRFRSQ
jgi:hypothetical protein